MNGIGKDNVFNCSAAQSIAVRRRAEFPDKTAKIRARRIDGIGLVLFMLTFGSVDHQTVNYVPAAVKHAEKSAVPRRDVDFTILI